MYKIKYKRTGVIVDSAKTKAGARLKARRMEAGARGTWKLPKRLTKFKVIKA